MKTTVVHFFLCHHHLYLFLFLFGGDYHQYYSHDHSLLLPTLDSNLQTPQHPLVTLT